MKRRLFSQARLKLASLNIVVDRLVHAACWNRLFMASWTNRSLDNVVGTIMINQQPFSCMIELHVVRE